MTKKNQAVAVSPPLQTRNVTLFPKNKQSRKTALVATDQSKNSIHQKPTESHSFLQAMKAKTRLSKQAIGIVNSIKEYLGQNPLSEKTTFDFAQETNIDRRLLQKWFKEIEGSGIKEYSATQRLTVAKKLLEEGDKSIKQIAAICRYRSQGYFSRVFKKKYGVTPVEWKRQNS